MTRIFYFCPDFPQPSGGVKTLYRHVDRLRQLGFEAAIVHQKRDFRLTWHGYDVPIVCLEDRPQFSSVDVWVFPEVMADMARQIHKLSAPNQPARRVVIQLSWAPAYNRLRPGERWQDLGIAHVLTCSPTIQRHLQWSMQCEATLIPEVVDGERYRPQAEEKLAQIAFTTRKDPSGEWLQGVLTGKGQPFNAFTWLPLRNMDEATYASHLRQSAIFVASTMQEGTHISVLEALACGCLVVGYAGVGGNDYLVGEGAGQNAILVENGNLLQLGQRLENVLRAWNADRQKFAPILENALATARCYQDPTAESEALREFFSMLVSTNDCIRSSFVVK